MIYNFVATIQWWSTILRGESYIGAYIWQRILWKCKSDSGFTCLGQCNHYWRNPVTVPKLADGVVNQNVKRHRSQFWCNLALNLIDQGILKGEVSLYSWPPVWLFWIGLFCKKVSCHTADSKPVKQEVNSTVILPPLVFPASTKSNWIWIIYTGEDCYQTCRQQQHMTVK